MWWLRCDDNGDDDDDDDDGDDDGNDDNDDDDHNLRKAFQDCVHQVNYCRHDH